jgi:ADP-heptose:LPS heptosyltransferase
MPDIVDRQRRLDRLMGPPICWALTQLHKLDRVRTRPPVEIKRILIIVLSEMGALVLARQMFERLRVRYPGAEFFVLCFERNREVLDLLDLVPPERVLGLESGSVAGFLRDSVRAVRRIRAVAPDVVIDLELFARASAVYSGLSGAAIRVGFSRHTQEGLYRGDFINRPVPYNPYQHISEQFVTLAEAIESPTVPKVKRLVPQTPAPVSSMTLRAGELDDARAELYQRFPGIAGRPLVFLCPGAGLLPLRAWPVASYARVARELQNRGFAVAVVGLPQDVSLARIIQAACSSETCIDLTSYTQSVRALAVLFHLGALLIANDGGTGHFAALTPIPTILLFGPETPLLYGSVSPHAVNLHKPLSCSPCVTAYNHRQSPCDGDNVCLKSISVDEVLTVAYRQLDLSTLS